MVNDNEDGRPDQGLAFEQAEWYAPGRAGSALEKHGTPEMDSRYPPGTDHTPPDQDGGLTQPSAPLRGGVTLR